MPETWLPVVDSDTYEVSDEGHVRRMRASTKYPLRYPVGRMLKQSPDSYGYARIGLTDANGKRRWNKGVHQLVWKAFRGPVPTGLEINHKDGNKMNAALSNLEVITKSENILHSFRVLGKVNSQAKVTPKQVVELRERRATGEKPRELGKTFGLHPQIISAITSGKLWPHLPGPRTLPKHPCQTNYQTMTRISLETIREILRRKKAGETAIHLGEEFAIPPPTIHQWARGAGRAAKL